MLREGREIGVHRREHAVSGAIPGRGVLLQIERAPVPVGIVEDDVLVLIHGRVIGVRTTKEPRPAPFRARLVGGEDRFPRLAILGWGHDRPNGLDLRGRQARGVVARTALQRAGIEVALRGVLDEAVRRAVDGVARGDHGLVENLLLGRRDGALMAGKHRQGHLDPPRVEVRLGVGRRTRDDAIEVVREARGLDERLTSARRAAVEIGQPRTAAVEPFDDRLRGHRHLVLRAVGVVDELLGVAQGEAGAVAGVAGIGRDRSVPLRHRACQRAVADGTRPASVPDGLELVVPPGSGEPDFDLDVRVGRRRQRRGHPAEARELRIRAGGAAARAGRREGPGLDYLDGIDVSRAERDRAKIGARRPCRL